MKKEIKDYLHLYLGCSCEFKPQHNLSVNYYGFVRQLPLSGTEVLMSVVEDDIGEAPENTVCYAFAPDIKPILRPLSDMTDEERREWASVITNSSIKTAQERSGEEFRWLLSKHFDLFGLIEAGLAIDKPKVPEQN